MLDGENAFFDIANNIILLLAGAVLKTLEDVPERLREEVKRILEEMKENA